jgi:ribosomal protein S27AE
MAEKAEKKKAEAYKPPKKLCPKCGRRMAIHSDRMACGYCSYTEWEKKG